MNYLEIPEYCLHNIGLLLITSGAVQVNGSSILKHEDVRWTADEITIVIIPP